MNKQRLHSPKWWPMPPSANAIHAGIPSASFSNDAELNGGADEGPGLTLISGVVTERCRQDGFIRQVIAYVRSTGATGRCFKFKVFRHNGVNYDFIGESEQIVPSGINTQTFNLSQPIPCRPGDVFGVWIQAEAAPKLSIAATSKPAPRA